MCVLVGMPVYVKRKKQLCWSITILFMHYETRKTEKVVIKICPISYSCARNCIFLKPLFYITPPETPLMHTPLKTVPSSQRYRIRYIAESPPPPPPPSGMLQMWHKQIKEEKAFSWIRKNGWDCCQSSPASCCCWVMGCDLQISGSEIRNVPLWDFFMICPMNNNTARQIIHLFIMQKKKKKKVT